MMELLFACAICRRNIVDYPNRNGRDRQLKPICRYCEGEYGDCVPQVGAFMDRRIAAQVSALANALSGEAHAQTWRHRYGSA